MGRRERLERRAERRREWAGKRRGDAAARFAHADELAKQRPLGQPILVGHHSEKSARAHQRRIETNMRKGSESAGMATRHESKAAGIEHQLATSIFSDDADALEQLQAKVEALEAQRERVKVINRAIRREMKAGLKEGWLDRVGATPKEREDIAINARVWGSPVYGKYVGQSLGNRIRQAKERMKSIVAQQARAEEAESAGGLKVTRHEEHNWCVVTFAEKPTREVLVALKAAGYRWGRGSWQGYLDRLPDVVKGLES